MSIRTPDINVMVAAARKAARGLVRDFNEIEHLQVSRKGPADFVTVADEKSERTIREELQKARPDWGFRQEEGGEVKGRDPDHVWVVDPLDGTTNFLHGLPHFCISIGLVVRDEPVAGVIYDPIKDELFIAEKGQGAYVNNRRLRVAAREKLDDAVIATGIPFRGMGDAKRFAAESDALMPQVAGIRRWGAAALDLAYVAAGRYDGFWEWNLNAWDIAAGIVLVREAGGTVSEPYGSGDAYRSGNILVANHHLHPRLAKVLKGAQG